MSLRARLQRYWRGYAKEDAWDATGSILHYGYLVIKEYMLQEWGNPPEFFCETHNRAMYEELHKFIEDYEALQEMLTSYPDEVGATAIISHSRKCEQMNDELVQEFCNILMKHGGMLWI